MRIRFVDGVVSLALVLTQVSGAVASGGGGTPSPAPKVPMTSSGLTYAVRFARMNPKVTVDQKKAVAQKAFEFIRERVAKNLDLKSPEDLYREFATHPDLMKGWNKTSDGKRIKDPDLGELVSEFNLLISQLDVEKTLGKCKDYKRNLGAALMEGTCSVCGCREGFGWENNLHLSWAAKQGQKKGKSGKSSKELKEPSKPKEYSAWMPGFAFGKNIEQLIGISDLGTYFASSARSGDPFAPTLDEVKTKRPDLKTPEDLAAVAMMAEFRGNAYKRAMLSGLKSELVNEIQFSDKYLGKSQDEIASLIDKRVDEEVSKQCNHCSLSRAIDQDLRTKLKNTMRSEIYSGSAAPYASRDAAAQLCGELKALNYVFDTEYQKQMRAAYLSGNGGKEPRGGLHNTQFSNAENAQAPVKLRLDRERRKVLSTVINSSQTGKLMLTKAMTWLDGNNAGNTRLKCTPGSEKEDAELIVKAEAEAVEAGNKFTKKLNDNVHPNDYSLKTFNEDLITLLKISPHPFGEAVMLSSSPGQASKFACDLIQVVSDQDLADAYLDDAILWGTVGLTVLSLGTLSPLSMAGLAVNATIGVASATGSLIHSNIAYTNAANYRTWSIAQDFDPYLRNFSQKEYERYQSLQTMAVIGYGFTVLDLNSIVMKAIKSGKTTSEALAEAENLLRSPPEKIYTEVLTTDAEVVLGGGKTVSKSQGKALYKAAQVDIESAKTVLKDAGFADKEVELLLARRIKEEAKVIVEKPTVKELDGVVVTGTKRKPVTGTRTEFGPGLQRDLFKPGEFDEILKTKGVVGLQEELEKIGLKTKKVVLEREVEVQGEIVTRKYDALMLDPALLSESNVTTNHLVNYLRRAQQRAGSNAPGVDVIFRLDDFGIKELGDFSQIGKVKEATFSKQVFEEYLRTGDAGPIIKHEYRHYLLYNKAGVSDDLQIIFEGMSVSGYEDRLVMHEYYNYHRQVWEEFATADMRSARSKIFSKLDEKSVLTKSDLTELVKDNGRLNAAARRSKQAGATATEMNENIISFVQEFTKIKSGLSTETAIITPSQYGVTVEAKVNGKWVTADVPCKSCELLTDDLTGPARTAIEQQVKEEVGKSFENLYSRAIKERELFAELKAVENKIEFQIFSETPVNSKELKELYLRQEKLRQQISREVGVDGKNTQNFVRPSTGQSRITTQTRDRAYGNTEGIGKVDFSGNKKYLGGTNILKTETQPERVTAFRDAYNQGKITRDMKISFQYGNGGSWETAHIVGYDKSKGIVRVRIGNDPRNTIVLDEYQIMTAKEIPYAPGKFESKEFKLERFSFDKEPELVVEKTNPESSVKINSEKKHTTTPLTVVDVPVNSGPVMAEIKTETGIYKTTFKQEQAYQKWVGETPTTHPGVSGLNATKSTEKFYYMNETETVYKNLVSVKSNEAFDLIKVRAPDGKIVEYKKPIFLERSKSFLKIEVDGVKKTFYWREVMQIDGKGFSRSYPDPKPFQLQP